MSDHFLKGHSTLEKKKNIRYKNHTVNGIYDTNVGGGRKKSILWGYRGSIMIDTWFGRLQLFGEVSTQESLSQSTSSWERKKTNIWEKITAFIYISEVFRMRLTRLLRITLFGEHASGKRRCGGPKQFHFQYPPCVLVALSPCLGWND